MDKDNLSVLATLLRRKGDTVLEGREKLSLNDSLLKNLNDAFNFVVEEEDADTSFLVIKTNNSKVEFFHDIQFLHDFVQKIVKLSVIRDAIINKTPSTHLDISRFRSLQFLELEKIPVQRVHGIQRIRSQLQCVVCVHCVQNLQDILIGCGGDKSSGFLWEELNEVVFTYNALEAIDSSFIYTPWLQSVDLSHNRLTSFCTVDCLPNLKYLNLGFNLLECAPTLSKEASRKLEILIIKNNYIRDISGIAKLENLKHFDASCNCLLDHSVLFPLQKLSFLVHLNLIGNPLSFHSQHRVLTLQLLHRNVANYKFTLDQRSLSCRERSVLRRAKASAHNIPIQPRDFDHSASITESNSSACTAPNAPHRGGDAPKCSRPSRKVQEAVIVDTNDVSDSAEHAVQEPPASEGSVQHLQLKRQVEELRSRFGEEHWLSQHGASQLRSVLGLPAPSPPSIHEQLAAQIPASEAAELLPPTPAEPEVAQEVQQPTAQEEHQEEVQRENEQDRGDKEECEENMSSTESEEDASENQLFTVRRFDDPSESLLLAVGSHHLRERELNTGQVRQRWELSGLQSCEQTSNSPPTVQLTFDTLLINRYKRTYLMELEEAQVLVRMLGNILSSRSLSEMNQVPYRCMKCSTQFSYEEVPRSSVKFRAAVTCPSCRSQIVCMMEEVPLPAAPSNDRDSAKPIPGTATTQPSTLNTSPSQSSTGSEEDGRSPGQSAPRAGEQLQVAAVVHTAPSASSPSALASARSTVSLESASNGSAMTARRYDSDIEVISNPSQSSIEILEGESRTPGRKRSSEERHLVVEVPQNVPPPPPALGLTESSSSGSFTDSVCTTYETHAASSGPSETEERAQCKARGGKRHVEAIDEDIEDSALYEPKPTPTVQEMLDGLLESVDKKLAISSNPPPTTNSGDSAIEYSYSNFQCIDHRLKLYLLQYVLEEENEDLLLLLRADILLQGQTMSFPGLLVFSSLRLRVLRITGPEGESPELWLRKEVAHPLSKVQEVFPLPWAQGVGLSCADSPAAGRILALLQDQKRTHSFLSAAEAMLPSSCGVAQTCAEYHHLAVRHLVLTEAPSGEADAAVRLVALFCRFASSGQEELTSQQGALVVTTCDLFVTQTDMQWLFPNSGSQSIASLAAQKMSNLLEVEVCGCSLGLLFLDEARNMDTPWTLEFHSAGCVDAVVAALRAPWEQLFCVPLQVTSSVK